MTNRVLPVDKEKDLFQECNNEDKTQLATHDQFYMDKAFVDRFKLPSIHNRNDLIIDENPGTEHHSKDIESNDCFDTNKAYNEMKLNKPIEEIEASLNKKSLDELQLIKNRNEVWLNDLKQTFSELEEENTNLEAMKAAYVENIGEYTQMCKLAADIKSQQK